MLNHNKNHNNPAGLTKKIICIPIIAICVLILLVVFIVNHNDNTEYSAQAVNLNQQALEQRQIEEAEDFYQKLSDGIDVNILILGDMLGTGAGVSDTAQNWDQLLDQAIEEEYGINCNITNLSMNGDSYTGYVQINTLKDGVDYDLAILCYGQTDSFEKFSLYYESVIRSIRKMYGNCEIISVLESSQREYTEKIREIVKISDHYDIPTSDMIYAYNNSGYTFEELNAEEIYPSDIGCEVYRDTLMDTIAEEVEKHRVYNSEEIEPLNQLVTEFEFCEYYPIGEFERKDSVSFELEVEIPVSGIMGIDLISKGNSNFIEIYIDEKLYSTENIMNKNSQQCIFVVSSDVDAKETIQVKFKTEESARGFRGLILSSQAFNSK